MPETRDFHAIVPAVNAVNDAVRAKDYFAQVRTSKFGNDATALGKGREGQGGVEQVISHSFARRNIFERDVGDDPLEIA
jgi:hypothetical protein